MIVVINQYFACMAGLVQEMVGWKLKNCSRCGGDMFIASDLYGWYQQCLQCSYRQDLKEISKPKDQSLRKREELVGTRGNRAKKG